MSVSEWTIGDQFDNAAVLCVACDRRTTKNGDPYLAGRLRDKTAELPFRIWDDGALEPLDPGTVYQIGGSVVEWDGGPQVDIDYYKRLAVNDTADPHKFADSAHRPPPKLLVEFVRHFCRMTDPPVQRAVFETMGVEYKGCVPDEPTIEDFDNLDAPVGLLEAPAAKRMHHARVGGLLEHMCSMLRHAMRIVEFYEPIHGAQIDLDALAAGIALHDLGKVDELSGPIGTVYSERHALRGHIPIGVVRWHETVRHGSFAHDEELDASFIDHVSHLILSHHGRKEWGSPVEPKTPEAHLLHRIDMLDSQVDPIFDALPAVDADEAPAEVETTGGNTLKIPANMDFETLD